MTTRPYELLARFGTEGKIQGVSVRYLTTVDGRDYEGDPIHLSAAVDDPAFAAFAEQFSAAIVAERDSLEAFVEDLQQQLAAVKDNLGDPRWINPDAFQDRFTRAELREMAASDDPVVIEMATQLKSVVAANRLANMNDAKTSNAIAYLVSIGILAADRPAQILSNSSARERK